MYEKRDRGRKKREGKVIGRREEKEERENKDRRESSLCLYFFKQIHHKAVT